MSLTFAVVHEAPADFRTATELADRVLVESIDWLDDDQVEYARIWLQEASGVPLTWKQVKRSALDAGIPAIGFFDGEPAEPDAQAARRAIRYLRYALPDLAAVLLLRDQDDQPERRAGLEQARRQEAGRFPVIVGLAVVEALVGWCRASIYRGEAHRNGRGSRWASRSRRSFGATPQRQKNGTI